MQKNEKLPNEPSEEMARIDEPYINPRASILPDRSYLQDVVAISSRIKDFENKRVAFSFKSYDQNKCQLKDLDKRDAKELTQTLGKASALTSKELLGCSNGVKCTPVINAGNYAVLFNHLPKDVELREIHYSDAGRVFGHIVENLFFVTTITKKHIKYD